jgi:holo-[acyl-carrier protein] synthase
MITGIGIDIVQINRMEHWINNTKLLERFFHPQELITASARNNSAALALAARFAAKEAFGKALGTIMVHNNSNGKPEMVLYGTAQRAFEKSGASIVHVSLSHEKENAIAMIVLESQNAG